MAPITWGVPWVTWSITTDSTSTSAVSSTALPTHACYRHTNVSTGHQYHGPKRAILLEKFVRVDSTSGGPGRDLQVEEGFDEEQHRRRRRLSREPPSQHRRHYCQCFQNKCQSRPPLYTQRFRQLCLHMLAIASTPGRVCRRFQQHFSDFSSIFSSMSSIWGVDIRKVEGEGACWSWRMRGERR